MTSHEKTYARRHLVRNVALETLQFGLLLWRRDRAVEGRVSGEPVVGAIAALNHLGRDSPNSYRFLERFCYMCPLLFSCVFPS
jgi:hypothetical protein